MFCSTPPQQLSQETLLNNSLTQSLAFVKLRHFSFDLTLPVLISLSPYPFISPSSSFLIIYSSPLICESLDLTIQTLSTCNADFFLKSLPKIPLCRRPCATKGRDVYGILVHLLIQKYTLEIES